MLLGREASIRLGAKPTTLLWLIDVFGQSVCMPQLMRLAGLEALYTVKQHWSRLTKFPYDSFRWRSPDGSEVLVHAPADGNYCQHVDLAETINLLDRHQQSDVHPEVLIATGYGDGGGGVTASMCERARRLADLNGVPHTKWGTADAFVRRLQKIRTQLPVWEGEIYLERHQGVSTGENRTKSAYRAAERALQADEAAQVVAGQELTSDAHAALTADWQRVCLTQFHDCITGTSIGQVFAAVEPDMQGIASRRLTAARLRVSHQVRAAKSSPQISTAWFNPLTTSRVITATIPPSAKVPAGTGQRVASGTLIQLTLPATGVVPFSSAALPAHPVTVTATRLDNGRVAAEFDRAGRLIRLSVDGQDLGLKAPARFILHRNQPLEHDAWDIEGWDLAQGDEVATGLRLSISERGPLRAVLEGTAVVATSPLRVRWILEAGSAWLRCEVEIDWRERQRLLKLRLPTTWNGSLARFGAPFGAVLRTQRPARLHELAQWESTGLSLIHI
jgi:alpha-mannosidase